ncbi:precorrin-2 C20-methyltransferase / precorrin-3B C17-methyltransferase [Jatrophihabitans endophyticus]|uniref:Precorrin-2 C20-methyltransferase / precorrin-3B C17-methyltransferase n=1 Tax=Jatrophihabitans endophyticus TaxID=1206085 RepID=A0A1M5Q5I1_9ACTN|nr:precorrin-2 C(20)-methyltransferase [Jatrophihabitans endophyticus]SHH09507.1 precorrin-2 C20-methyltransferase / precorrin-3B C17-methyltransferase [Jatrophihabitans endophyticus]
MAAPTGAGTLYGVGLGPGDPELVTVRAARLIGAAHVVAYHSARHGRSVARAIAEPYLRDGQVEEQLVYPVTTETTEHPGGYEGAINDFYEAAAARLAEHLAAGRDVVLLAEGDPLFFSSYMHMHKRIAGRFRTEIVPGVTSVSAAAAALAQPLVEGNDVLTVLPGTLPPDVLAERLAQTDAAAIMKVSRHFAGVQDALKHAGRIEDAYYVERASAASQRTERAGDVDPASVPYMSLVIVPGPEAAQDPVATATGGGTAAAPAGGRVDVVGLGPAGRDWLTPQAMAVLAAADDVVGYSTYVARVPANPRQRRHASDNKVEAERAEFALDLARRGRRVAVVSSGDPGVFAMASAVLEAATDERYAGVPVDIVPGLTAAQAVASRAGAPLGHDYAVISLSDRLKPWDVVAARLDAAARADLAIAIYNPASQTRRQQLHDARDVLLRHRDPVTPVVVGRAVGSDDETVTVTTLGELDPETVDMRCLLIVGSSQTRTLAVTGEPRVFTPRRYPAAD